MAKKIKRETHEIYMARFDPGSLHNPDSIIDSYRIGDVEVYIVDREGYGYYYVNEPPLDDEEYNILSSIIDEFPKLTGRRALEIPKEYIDKTIDENLEKYARIKGLKEVVSRARERFKYYIKRETAGYRRLDVLFRDDDIEEISCTSFKSPVYVIHRRYNEYDWMKTNIGFKSLDDMNKYVRWLTQISGKQVTTAHPYIDAISPTGERIAVTYGREITLPGPTIAVRKFPKNPLTITKLLSFNSLSPLMAAYLWLLLEAKGYIMIVGGMGTGKTTLLSCLTNLINPIWKVATIEDTPEVKTFHEQWQRFISRVPTFKTETSPITLVNLAIISLRYRPDYIIVGETRSVEVQALTQAASLGHGCMTTFHGSDSRYALTRMAAPPLNVGVSEQILIWAIVTTRRVSYQGKSVRRVIKIEEIDPYFSEYPKLIEVFKWNPLDDSFFPNDPEEVVKRSSRRKMLMDYTGWSEEDIIDELRRRSEFLSQLVEDKVFNYIDVVEAVKKFYARRKVYEEE